MRAVAIACTLFGLCATSHASAQSYVSSPHVEGDGATVRVYYDQKVNHTHVKKEVFVYQGPKTEDVLSAVQQIVNQRQAELDELVNKDDMKSLRNEVLAQLHRQFREQPDVMAAIRRLAPIPARHRGHWSIAAGLSTVVAGGPGLGGNIQLDGHLNVLQPGTFRQSLGLRVGLEVLERSQYSPGGLTETLGETYRLSFHGWLEPGYEIFWFKGHLALQISALIGAQTFEEGVGDRYTVAYGVALAPELRIGSSNGTGVSIGVKYRAASMTRPVFPFESPSPLMPRQQAEHALQHFVLLYAGMYFSLFGS